MAEEFEESEILFREAAEVEHGDQCVAGDFPGNIAGKRRKLIFVGHNKENSSVPINIPESIDMSENRLFVSDFGGDGEFVPPHVVIGRRVAGKVMAFSLCTGNGRTLKGRDLSKFRNSILRMTGFLET